MDQHTSLGSILGSGANADVYEYGEGKVVKLYRSKENKGSIHAEIRNHQFAEQTGIAMPHYYGLVEINGLPGLVYERIDGETIADRLIRSMDDSDVLLLARLMHSINKTPIGHLDYSGLPTVKGVLDWQIGHGGGLTNSEKEAVKQLLIALPDRTCLCHSDMNPQNIIISGGRPIVIDWQGTCIGHPAYDAAQLILIWKYAVLSPKLIPQEAIRAFETIRLGINTVFCAEYCRLSGLSQAELDVWIVPVAAAKLNTDLCDEEREILIQVVKEGLRSGKIVCSAN